MAEMLSGRARNQTQDSPHKLLGNQHPRDGTDSGVSAINPTGALEIHSARRRIRPADGSSGSNAVTTAPQPQHPDGSPHRRTSRPTLFIGAPPPHPNSQDHLPPLSPNSQLPHTFLHQSNTGRGGAAPGATSTAGPAPPPAPPLVSLRSRISPSTGTGLMAPASDRLRPSGAASTAPVMMSSRFRNTGVSGRGAGSGAAGALKPAGTSRSVARGRPHVVAPGRTGGVRQAIRRGAPVVGPGSAAARAAESRAAAAAAPAAAAGTSSAQPANGPQSTFNNGPDNDLELNNSNTAGSATSLQRRESEPPSGSNSALLRPPFLSQRQPQTTGTETSTSTVPPPLHSSFVPLLPLQGLQHRQSANSGAGLQHLPGSPTAAAQQHMTAIDTGGVGSGGGSGDAQGSQPSGSRPSSSRILEGSSYPRYSQFQIPLITLQQQQQQSNQESQPQTPPPQAPRAPSQHQLDLGLLGIGPLSMFGPLATAPALQAVSMASTIRPPSAAPSTGGGAGAEPLRLRALTPPTFTSSTTSFPATASTSDGGRGLPSSSSSAAAASNAHTSRAAAAPMTRFIFSHSLSRNADDGGANEAEPQSTSIAFGPNRQGSSTTDRARSFDAALAAALSLEGEPPSPQPQPPPPSLSSFPPPPALTHGSATSAAPSCRARTGPSAVPSTGPRRSDLVPSGRNAGSDTTLTSSSQHPLSNRAPRVSAAASTATTRVPAVPSTTPPAGPPAPPGGTAARIDRRPLARRNSSGSSSTASAGAVTASGGAGGGGDGRGSGSNGVELSVVGRISGGTVGRTGSGLLGDQAGAGAAARRGVTHANGRMDARDSSGLRDASPAEPGHSRDPSGEGTGMVGEQQRRRAGVGGADGAGGQGARLVGRRRESGNVTVGNATIGGRMPLAPGGGGAGTGAARAAAAAAATRLMYDTHYGHTSDGDSDDSDDNGNGVIDGVRHHAVIHPPPRVFRMHLNEQHAADTTTFGPARALGPPPRPPPVLGARRRTSDDDGVVGGALALGGGGGGGSFQDRFLADLHRRDVERAMLMQLLLAGGEEELLRQAEEEQLAVALMLSLHEARPGAPDAAGTEPEPDAGRAGGAGAGAAPAPRTFTLRLTPGALLGLAHGSLLVPVAEEPSFSYEDLLTLEDVKVTTPQELLDGLPVSTYDGTSSAPDGACAICQCDYEVGEQLVRLPCLHVLHNTCARQWLGGYSKRCPICKQALC